jgi:hypothetical protein
VISNSCPEYGPYVRVNMLHGKRREGEGEGGLVVGGVMR